MRYARKLTQWTRPALARCLAALVAAALCASPAQAQGPGMAANVRVAEVAIQPMAPMTLVPGTVVSRNDARLSAEEAGRLVSVAEIGTRVRAGEELARIDDTTLRLRRDELEAEVQRAEARLDFLEKDEARFVRLAESNLAAAAQLEETRSNRDVARGDLAVARARLGQVQESLARTRLLAPFDGVVVERLAMPGERVDVGGLVVRLVDQVNLEVIARAPLEYYEYTQVGQEVGMRAGERQALGLVRTVVAVGDEDTHQFELRIDVEPGLFPVGKTLRVAIPMSGSRNVLAIPRDALVLRPEGVTVFVVDSNDQARQVRVTTGVGSGDQIEVLGALSPGDRVVIRGNERLTPGQAVRVVSG